MPADTTDDPGTDADPGNGHSEAQKSRRLMLEAAWDIVVESFGFGEVSERRASAKMLEQLKAADIAHRAGLTTGAFYNRWPNRDAFLSEFIDYALSVDRSPTYARLNEVVAEFSGPPGEMLATIAREDIHAIVSNPAFAIHTHLWSMMRSRPDINERMAVMYDEYRESTRPLVQAMLAATARRPRPEFSVEEIVQLVMAMSEGMSLQVAAGGDGAPEASLFGRFLLALLPCLTEPVDEGAGLA